jgi:hypothetical protein
MFTRYSLHGTILTAFSLPDFPRTAACSIVAASFCVSRSCFSKASIARVEPAAAAVLRAFTFSGERPPIDAFFCGFASGLMSPGSTSTISSPFLLDAQPICSRGELVRSSPCESLLPRRWSA